jgi:hypothetical protein
MQEYITYIKSHCLWILSVAILGVVVLWLADWKEHITGWLWGMMMCVAYFLYLAFQTYKMKHATLEDVKRRVWIGVMSRFSLLVVLAAISTQIPSISMKGILGAVCVFAPMQYIEYSIHVRQRTR